MPRVCPEEYLAYCRWRACVEALGSTGATASAHRQQEQEARASKQERGRPAAQCLMACLPAYSRGSRPLGALERKLPRFSLSWHAAPSLSGPKSLGEQMPAGRGPENSPGPPPKRGGDARARRCGRRRLPAERGEDPSRGPQGRKITKHKIVEIMSLSQIFVLVLFLFLLC